MWHIHVYGNRVICVYMINVGESDTQIDHIATNSQLCIHKKLSYYISFSVHIYFVKIHDKALA